LNNEEFEQNPNRTSTATIKREIESGEHDGDNADEYAEDADEEDNEVLAEDLSKQQQLEDNRYAHSDNKDNGDYQDN
jgi:hypothetical protein